MDATVRVTEEAGGWKMMRVSLTERLSRETEQWFVEYLSKAEGVAYTEFDTSEQWPRLAGYGVWEPNWSNFQFWLGVLVLGGLTPFGEVA